MEEATQQLEWWSDENLREQLIQALAAWVFDGCHKELWARAPMGAFISHDLVVDELMMGSRETWINVISEGIRVYDEAHQR